MLKQNLTKASTQQLLDLLTMPQQLTLVEEEVLVLAELATRYLTTRQRLMIRRKMSVGRRQYNYACCQTSA